MGKWALGIGKWATEILMVQLNFGKFKSRSCHE